MKIIDTFDSIHIWRDPELIRRKRLKMSNNPVAFFRWSNHLFYQYMSEHLWLQSPYWWVCGDLHIENFGIFRGLDNQVYFDINDFDEANRWQIHRDIARLMTSIAITYSASGTSSKQVSEILNYTQDRYISMMLEGKIGTLINLDNDTSVQKYIHNIIKNQSQTKFIEHIVDHNTMIRWDEFVDILPSQYVEIEQMISKLLQYVRGTKILDIAKHIVGNSSLWVDRYTILIKWKKKHHHLLDLKQASSSVLSNHSSYSSRNNNAQRIISIQKIMQANSSLLLSTLQINEKSFILKEMQSVEDKISLDPNNKDTINFQIIDEMVYALVRAQLSSCDIWGSVGLSQLMEHVEKLQWDFSLQSFALQYVDYNITSYRQFCEELFYIQ